MDTFNNERNDLADQRQAEVADSFEEYNKLSEEEPDNGKAPLEAYQIALGDAHYA